MKEAISLLITPSDFYIFTLGETWQNKINKTSIRAIYIFKLQGCYWEEAISLLRSRST